MLTRPTSSSKCERGFTALWLLKSWLHRTGIYQMPECITNHTRANTGTRAHKKTRNSADADKPARRIERRIERSVKVTKHSTIPYVRYFSSCAIVTLSLRRAVLLIFDFTKCRDLEIRVRGHSRSSKVLSFDRSSMVSY